MSCCNQAPPPTLKELWKKGYMALIITKQVQGFKPGDDVSDLGNAQQQLLLEWGAAKIVETKTKRKVNEKSTLPGKD